MKSKIKRRTSNVGSRKSFLPCLACAGLLLAAAGCRQQLDPPFQPPPASYPPPAPWDGSIEPVTVIYVFTGGNSWFGGFYPNGSAYLVYGSSPPMYTAPEGSFSFEEVYNLLLPHAKDSNKMTRGPSRSGKTYAGFFSFFTNTANGFYFEDKKAVRMLMYGLRDKVEKSARLDELLEKYPLVWGDPPNGKDTPIPSIEQVSGFEFFTLNGWTGKFLANGETSLSHCRGEMFLTPVSVNEKFDFEEIYNLIIPHLKQGADDDKEILRITWLLDNSKIDWMYIDDKETMRTLLHGLFDNVAMSHGGDNLVEAQKTHPIVPSDPSYQPK